MKSAKETIYNFSEKKEDLIEEVKNSIEYWKKCGLVVDVIEISFEQLPKYQSNPEEGNLPK
jgi:flagellar biosynthesis/type III secretory pathway M-ring protein FliF/YscJ